MLTKSLRFSPFIKHIRSLSTSTTFNFCHRVCAINLVFSRKLSDTKASQLNVYELGRLGNSQVGREEAPQFADEAWVTPIYPADLEERKKKLDKERMRVDPRNTTVFLFPGQGSQFVGMGRNLITYPNVEEMFHKAKQILGYDLLRLCIDGPREELSKTQYCQAAIFVTSLAAIERLRVDKPGVVEACVAAAGFSVGELAALVFSGAITYEDGLRLVKVRAEAMQYASDLAPSGMVTVIYGPDAKIRFACEAAEKWCQKKGIEEELAVCKIANYLFPHCKVIAGHEEALKFLELNMKDFGIRRIKKLPVSGAFHTPLMKPAKKVFQSILDKIPIEQPLIPVYSNCTGKKYYHVSYIRKYLPLQIVKPVRWEQIMHEVYDRKEKDANTPVTYECGPGKTLINVLEKVHGVARRSSYFVEV